jgi:uncharacterized protein (TIGR02246 family)
MSRDNCRVTAWLRQLSIFRVRRGTIVSSVVLMRRVLASCFAIILLPGILQGPTDAKSTVAKLNEAWLDAYKAADFDQVAALYAADAVVMPNSSEPVQGREAIRNFFVESIKNIPQRSMALKSFRVEASGILLMDSGEYTFDGVNTEGNSVHIVGNYITVFKKVDGRWRTAIEIWNVRTPEESK